MRVQEVTRTVEREYVNLKNLTFVERNCQLTIVGTDIQVSGSRYGLVNNAKIFGIQTTFEDSEHDLIFSVFHRKQRETVLEKWHVKF